MSRYSIRVPANLEVQVEGCHGTADVELVFGDTQVAVFMTEDQARNLMTALVEYLFSPVRSEEPPGPMRRGLYFEHDNYPTSLAVGLNRIARI